MSNASAATILIIEDEPGVALLQRRTLERADFRVLQAANAREALACVREGSVDLIVLDFYLPEETTGLTFFRELKAKGHDIPVILVTGRSEEALVIEALRAGVRDFVVKTPDYLSYLAHAVDRVLKQVQLEQQLRQSEERCRSLVDHAYDAIFTFSPNGEITSLNPAFERMTGWQRSDWIGKSFPPLIHPDDLPWARKLFRRVLYGERPPSFELRVATHAGDFVPVEFTMTSQTLGDATVGVIGIGRDIRERRSLEEQIRQMQKLDSIGQFAAGIAHDFNNIVTVQQGFASLLLQEPDLPVHLTELVQQIAEASDRATKLTRQLLQFSRKQAMQPQRLQLNSVVHELSNMLSRILGAHIVLRLKCAEHLPMVFADPGMVEQVLMNLAINARDSMVDGGRLVIATSSVELDELAARPNPEARPGAFVCIEVADTGTGIQPEVLQHMFEPLFTTKEANRGTGLGLATVHGIVKQHQGWIEVRTEVGKGTALRIYLPAIPAVETSDHPIEHRNSRWMPTSKRPDIDSNIPADAVLASDASMRLEAIRASDEHRHERPVPVEQVDQSIPPASSGHRVTILLAEDEAPLRKMITVILKRQGYEVLTAASGIEALRIWRERRSSIQLLITDMVMPHGMTGRQLAEQLWLEDSSLKVIFTSGYLAEIVGIGTNVSDQADFLQKPFTASGLSGTVHSILTAKSPPVV